MPLRVIQHYSDWVCTAVMSNDVMTYIINNLYLFGRNKVIYSTNLYIGKVHSVKISQHLADL